MVSDSAAAYVSTASRCEIYRKIVIKKKKLKYQKKEIMKEMACTVYKLLPVSCHIRILLGMQQL